MTIPEPVQAEYSYCGLLLVSATEGLLTTYTNIRSDLAEINCT